MTYFQFLVASEYQIIPGLKQIMCNEATNPLPGLRKPEIPCQEHNYKYGKYNSIRGKVSFS
jgi:hypothetical protein